MKNKLRKVGNFFKKGMLKAVINATGPTAQTTAEIGIMVGTHFGGMLLGGIAGEILGGEVGMGIGAVSGFWGGAIMNNDFNKEAVDKMDEINYNARTELFMMRGTD
jgi:outer membrane lipoprotein SlyB